MSTRTPVAGPGLRPRHSRAVERIPRTTRPRRLLAAALLLGAVVAAGATFVLQGYRMYVVHTGSMEPTFRPGDLVVDRPVDRVRPGEVITFRHSDLATDVVTHRVTSITPAGLIHTKGDANATGDAWEIRPDQVQGRVAVHLRGLGYFAVYLRNPAGVASLITALLAVLLLWTIFFPSEPEPHPAT